MANYKLIIGAAGLQPAWLSNLLPGEFVQLGANSIEDVDPRYDVETNPNYPDRGPWTYNSTTVTNDADASSLITSWGGAAYDKVNKRLIFTGGGHNDYGGNEVISVELNHASPTFVRYKDPYLGDGTDGNLDDGQEATNQYASGEPRSIHSYNALQTDGTYLYMSACPAPFQTATSTYGCFWRFNLTTKVWERLLQETNVGNAGRFYACATTCYDTTNNRIYGWANNAVDPSYYSISAGTFHTETSVQPNLDSTESWLLYIPELHIQLCLNRLYDDFIGVFDYGVTPNSGQVSTPGATGNAPGVSPTYSTLGYDTRMYPNGVWVPGYAGGVGAVICWHGGKTLYVLTPPSSGNYATDPWTWSTRSITSTIDPGAVNANGLYGRVFYDSDYKVLGILKDYDAGIYFLQFPDSWFEA